jgi:hypothetical protein
VSILFLYIEKIGNALLSLSGMVQARDRFELMEADSYNCTIKKLSVSSQQCSLPAFQFLLVQLNNNKNTALNDNPCLKSLRVYLPMSNKRSKSKQNKLKLKK